jgi:hypothetical protein
MQDQVADPIGADGSAQQPAGPEDRLLPNEVIETAGAHALRQGRQAREGGVPLVAEEISHETGPRPLV